MRLSQLQQPLRAAASSLLRPTLPLAESFSRLQITNTNALVSGRRHASVKAQGAYKLKPKKTIMKKLGAKRTGDQYVIPGNIIYKQRGSVWHPGENCIMGRDHTIHAMATGFVKYYRDPSLHPKRKYIGVALNKEDTLPYPPHAERKRRLNKSAHTIAPREVDPPISASGIPTQVVRTGAASAPGKQAGPPRVLRLRDDYSYREDNWRIGRLVKLTGVTKFRGGRGYGKSRSARFRSARYKRERSLEGERKVLERDIAAAAKEGASLDEWAAMAQKKKLDDRAKQVDKARVEKQKKAEKMAKQRMAGMNRARAKKN
ncbi:50S ribosomal protein L27 [Plectosphaerella cucumerina]|uniref:Large ribosomal subunit protein bL27m n=1 Tax=Plectosphaerella cucumerina TaxID=40658 RepID=A0A8K0TNB0_9PEZI|nr:50S ribosomal protein L27 [Plectosphaerella cucumerina]